MKVFISGLFHEANAFSPVETPASSFFLYHEHVFKNESLSGLWVGFEGFLGAVKASGDNAIAGFFANATPSAPCSRETFGTLEQQLLESLTDAGEVDAVLLFLHGAQTSEGCDDCAGRITQRVRDLVGTRVPIGVLMDLHANVTDVMRKSANLVATCKEYPHTDFDDVAAQLWRVLRAQAGHQFHCHWRRVPAFPAATTTAGPMAGFLQTLRKAETSDHVLIASAIHGFPQADVPHGSAGILLYSRNKEKGTEITKQLADELFDAAVAAAPADKSLSPYKAVSIASMDDQRPVVIAERSDNPGAGGSGDGTHLLKALEKQSKLRAVVGLIHDPEAAAVAAQAGKDSQLTIHVGGKGGDLAGGPFTMNAFVRSVIQDAQQSNFGTGGSIPLGTSVLLQAGNLKVVVSSERQQAFDPSIFTDHGVSLSDEDVIAVKSTNHFYNGFSAIAARVLYCDGPGAGSEDLTALPYRRLSRPIYPIDSEQQCRASMEDIGSTVSWETAPQARNL